MSDWDFGVEKQCAVCKKKDLYTIWTEYIFEQSNLDLCPDSISNNIQYELMVCKHCGYVNYDIEDLVSESAEKVVFHPAYQKKFKQNYKSDWDLNWWVATDLAIDIYEYAKRDKDVGILKLRRVNEMDKYNDDRLTKRATEIRTEVISLFENHLAQTEDDDVSVALVELYRRNGLFEKAANLAKNLLEKQPDSKKPYIPSDREDVLKYQIALCEQHDGNIHMKKEMKK